ncbi:MAG: replicative DNA helicase [Planctomycetota bacterium]
MATVNRIDAGRSPRQPNATELFDRLPPQNLEAERGVLGSILLAPDVTDEIVQILRADDFYADANRKLFQHILAMRDEGKRIDATLLIERLRTAGDYEAVGGAAYLAEVAQAVPYAANATFYARIVREKATLRELIAASTDILRSVYEGGDDVEQLVATAEQKIFRVHSERTTDQVTSIHDVLIEALDRIDHRLEHGGSGGIPSGFTDLDRMTGGLHPSELVILAARPSMGKTALATNVAEYVALEANRPTLIVSLEMARLELAQRMLCSQGKIDANKFRNGFLSADDKRKLVEASAQLSKAPIYVDDTASRTVTEIAACARRLKRKQGLEFMMIDYLQLIQPDDPREPRQEQVAKIARRLKQLARELQIPLLCLAQLNRQAEAGKEGHRPKLSHLRESGAIEQDADVVMFIHREEYYHTREEAMEMGIVGQADLIIAKQRNGPTGDVKLAWFDKFTRFENLTEKPYDEFTGFQDEF